MKFLNYILSAVIGGLIVALIFSKCAKPKVETHWIPGKTDTVKLVVEKPVEVPKPYPVYIVRDSVQIKTVKIKGDSIPYVVIKTVKDSTPILANQYKDSIDFSGKQVKAMLHYDLITTGEMLSLDFDMDLFNSRECPAPLPPPRRLKNQLGANFGYQGEFYGSLDYTRTNFGLGLSYGLKTKSPGAYLRTQFRF